MALGEAAGEAAALSVEKKTSFKTLDVGELQRRLVKHNCNLGQGFRKLPALPDGDYGDSKIDYVNDNG